MSYAYDETSITTAAPEAAPWPPPTGEPVSTEPPLAPTLALAEDEATVTA